MRPVRPVLRALWEETSFPGSVFGPEENWALARLAASWASEIGEMVCAGLYWLGARRHGGRLG